MNRLVVAPSIADRLVRSPAGTITALTRAWWSDAPVSTADKATIDANLGSHRFCQDRSRTAAGDTKRDSPCTFPARCCAAPHRSRFRYQGAGTTRPASTRGPPGSHGALVEPVRALHFPPRAPRSWPLLRGEGSYIAMRVAIHVARTWRGGCRIFPSRKVRAIAAGTLGKRPTCDLHADARVSFLMHTWIPFYLRHAIKSLTWYDSRRQKFVDFCHPVFRHAG